MHFPVSSGISCSTVKARKRFPLANRNIEPKRNKHLVISVSASREHVLLLGVEGKLPISRFSEVEFTYTFTRACKRPSLEVGQLSETPTAHNEEGYSPCLQQENEASSHGTKTWQGEGHTKFKLKT